MILSITKTLLFYLSLLVITSRIIFTVTPGISGILNRNAGIRRATELIKSLYIYIYQPVGQWFVLWQLLLADMGVWGTYLFGILDADPEMAERIPLAQYKTINALLSLCYEINRNVLWFFYSIILIWRSNKGRKCTNLLTPWLEEVLKLSSFSLPAFISYTIL